MVNVCSDDVMMFLLSSFFVLYDLHIFLNKKINFEREQEEDDVYIIYIALASNSQSSFSKVILCRGKFLY